MNKKPELLSNESSSSEAQNCYFNLKHWAVVWLSNSTWGQFVMPRRVNCQPNFLIFLCGERTSALWGRVVQEFIMNSQPDFFFFLLEQQRWMLLRHFPKVGAVHLGRPPATGEWLNRNSSHQLITNTLEEILITVRINYPIIIKNKSHGLMALTQLSQTTSHLGAWLTRCYLLWLHTFIIVKATSTVNPSIHQYMLEDTEKYYRIYLNIIYCTYVNMYNAIA